MLNRVRKIAGRIIEESFPLLEGKRIFFIVIWFRFYAMSFLIPPCLRIIVISKRARKFTDSALTALIAHELCHQERYIRMGLRNYLKFIPGYLFSKKIQRSEEVATDLMAIEKGYARELYELTIISHKDDRHRKIIDNYLTPEEIREYALRKGVWKDPVIEE